MSLQSLEQVVGDAMNRQVERAKEENALKGVPLMGDARARSIFLTLLTPEIQRRIFMRTLRAPDAYPRASVLFGAPPYVFLGEGDAALLNSRGFSVGRANMTYNDDKRIPNYSQFGTAHCVDEAGRQYRIEELVGGASNENASPAVISMILNNPWSHVVMTVRIPKQSRAKKMELQAQDRHIRTFTMPISGEVLSLSLAPSLNALLPEMMKTRLLVTVRVSHLQMRASDIASDSSTARLVASRT